MRIEDCLIIVLIEQSVNMFVMQVIREILLLINVYLLESADLQISKKYLQHLQERQSVHNELHLLRHLMQFDGGYLMILEER